MKEIDWSKAPEGAQAYMPANDQWFEGWWKMVGAQSYFWAARGEENGRWEASNARPWGFRLLVKRPAELAWTGTGLPPVGIDIEVLHEIYGWIGARVVGSDGEAALVRTNDGYAGVFPHQFRPIRTPEQIAAEVREKAIKEMADAARCSGMPWIERFGALYDAGYRKAEAKQ